jgi:hypothetical protein
MINMRTEIFLEPESDHKLVSDLRQAFALNALDPAGRPSTIRYKNVDWNDTVDGYKMSLNRSIRDLPLQLKDAPVAKIIVNDAVESLDNSVRLVCGIYETKECRAEVDMYIVGDQVMSFMGASGEPRARYTVNVEGNDLTSVNTLYTAIRQGKANITELWDVTAPDN